MPQDAIDFRIDGEELLMAIVAEQEVPDRVDGLGLAADEAAGATLAALDRAFLHQIAVGLLDRSEAEPRHESQLLLGRQAVSAAPEPVPDAGKDAIAQLGVLGQRLPSPLRIPLPEFAGRRHLCSAADHRGRLPGSPHECPFTTAAARLLHWPARRGRQAISFGCLIVKDIWRRCVDAQTGTARSPPSASGIL